MLFLFVLLALPAFDALELPTVVMKFLIFIGCVHLWRTYSWKINVCENVSDLSTLHFENSVIAIKLDSWTEAELYEECEYEI